jgi:hypothetical protein
MLFFETRKLARAFAAKKEHYKLVDNGTASEAGRRWAVKFL